MFIVQRNFNTSIFILLKEGASARKTQTPAAQPVPRPGKNRKILVFFLLSQLKFLILCNALKELNFT